MILVENCHESFRQPVQFIKSAWQVAIQLLIMPEMERSTDGTDHFEGLERFRRKIRPAEESDNLRRNHHNVSDARALHRFRKR